MTTNFIFSIIILYCYYDIKIARAHRKAPPKRVCFMRALQSYHILLFYYIYIYVCSVCSETNRSAIIIVYYVCTYIHTYMNIRTRPASSSSRPQGNSENRSECVRADQCPQRVSNGYFETSGTAYMRL